MSCKNAYLQRTLVGIKTAQQVLRFDDDWVRNERVKSGVKVAEFKQRAAVCLLMMCVPCHKHPFPLNIVLMFFPLNLYGLTALIQVFLHYLN